MGLATLLAVSLLGAGEADAGPKPDAAASNRSEVEQAQGRGLVVDTSAVSPPLRVRHGSVDGEKVREVVSSNRAELRSCYERALLDDPHLSGACTVRIVIAKDGTVGTAGIQGSTLHSLSMQRCVLQLVRKWRFQPPADGRPAAVDYPLTFRKEEHDAGL
ncbi:MAG: TonB family protein [Myxococcaceae bacterium]|nr:MAG: TonB family protein [Myxococcaceae bacterium]